MRTPADLKELFEFISYLEDKYDLLDLEIEGIKPWQAHRVELYFEIGRRCGVFEKELQRSMNKIEKIKSLATLVKNSILNNPLFNLKQVDFLMFSHPRSKLVNKELIDIYSYHFLKENINKKYIEFEEHFEGKHRRIKNKNKRYLDYINLMRNIKTKFINLDLDDNNKNIIKNVQLEIDKISKFSLNLEKILIFRTKQFIVTYDIYKKILQKTMPKEIYIIVSYGRAELIKAAKDLNIKTIELQHGNFTKYHPGYSYLNRDSLDYFSNEFWVWNEYWKNLMSFSIPQNNIKIYPFKYLEEEKNKYNLTKNKNQILILGQGGISDRMAKKILDNANIFKNFKIIFKLHPNEYGKVSQYKNLLELKKKKDITIVENVDMYDLLAKSEYQAGVYSTALYEGVEFGCKTILFDLPGVEYMDKFIEMYEVEVI